MLPVLAKVGNRIRHLATLNFSHTIFQPQHDNLSLFPIGVTRMSVKASSATDAELQGNVCRLEGLPGQAYAYVRLRTYFLPSIRAYQTPLGPSISHPDRGEVPKVQPAVQPVQ